MGTAPARSPGVSEALPASRVSLDASPTSLPRDWLGDWGLPASPEEADTKPGAACASPKHRVLPAVPRDLCLQQVAWRGRSSRGIFQEAILGAQPDLYKAL